MNQAGSKPKGKRVVKDKYATCACNHCKKSKTKCINVDDSGVCSRCRRLNFTCEWGNEGTKRSQTGRHEQQLQRQNAELLAEINKLRQKLEENERAEPLDEKPIPSEIPEASIVHEDNDSLDIEFRVRMSRSSLLSAQLAGVHLTTPSKKLYLEDDDNLRMFGMTSVFRLAVDREDPPRIRDFATVDGGRQTHVILDPGCPEVQPHCHCWQTCWRAGLPTFDEPYLNRYEHDRVINLLFKFITSWGLRMIPSRFLQDMFRAHHSIPGTTLSTSHYSPMLHNIVLAVALAFSDHQSVSDVRFRRRFVKQAETYMDQEFERPTIAGVQSLALLAYFHAGEGEHNSAFVKFGMSARMAQSLGLGIDCTRLVKAGRMSEQDMFDRMWCFQMNRAQDACCSFYFGRDSWIGAEQAELDKLAMFSHGLDDETWSLPTCNLAPQPSNTFTCFLASCKLLRLSRGIMDVMEELSRRNGAKAHKCASEITKQLTEWKEGLEPALLVDPSREGAALPHKIMLHLVYWWLLILLHRPFFGKHVLSDDDRNNSRKICVEAADGITYLLDLWQRLFGLRYAPVTLVQTIVAAGSVYLLVSLSSLPHERMGALQGMQKIVDALHEASKSLVFSLKMAQELEYFLQELRPVHRPVPEDQHDRLTYPSLQPERYPPASIHPPMEYAGPMPGVPPRVYGPTNIGFVPNVMNTMASPTEASPTSAMPHVPPQAPAPQPQPMPMQYTVEIGNIERSAQPAAHVQDVERASSFRPYVEGRSDQFAYGTARPSSGETLQVPTEFLPVYNYPFTTLVEQLQME